MRWPGPALVLLALVGPGCATLPATSVAPGTRVAVLTPLDGVPVRSRDALPAVAGSASFEDARAVALEILRHDLACALADRGLEAIETDRLPLTGPRPLPATLAAPGGDADAVLFVELVAYGDIRRSWLWALTAQALLAGIGHGVVVGAATGNPGLAWLAGAGEFLLETVTWVGGAYFGSRGIDPVLMRAWLVRARDGTLLGHWTREGTRPVRQWFRKKGQPPRSARLRAVSGRVFAGLAAKVARRLARGDPPGPGPAQPSRTSTARE